MLVSGRFRPAPFFCAAFRSFSQSSTNRLHPCALTDWPQPIASAAGEKIMTSKHPKQNKPSDADLYRNPLIGGSKGTTMAHVTPDELEQLEGVNTIEGDIENDTNPQGGIDKAEVRNARRGAPDHGREPGPHIANGLHLDRKSTRLNSSHLVISYAVFCLKKKTNQIGTHSRLMPHHTCRFVIPGPQSG